MDPCLIQMDLGIKRQKQSGIVRRTVLLAVVVSYRMGSWFSKWLVAGRGHRTGRGTQCAPERLRNGNSAKGGPHRQ